MSSELNLLNAITNLNSDNQTGGKKAKRTKKSSKKSTSRSLQNGGVETLMENVSNVQEGAGRKKKKSTVKKSKPKSRGGNLLDTLTQTLSSSNQQGGYCGSMSSQRGGVRKPSAYNLFMKKKMGEMKKTHPKLTAPEKMKRIAAEWKKKKH
jgi:hypothetical protein